MDMMQSSIVVSVLLVALLVALVVIYVVMRTAGARLESRERGVAATGTGPDVPPRSEPRELPE